jgi:hypothetical protein
MFNYEQLNEIEQMAFSIVKERKCDELPWGQAWSGAHPNLPSSKEISKEFKTLKEKALRIIETKSLDLEYENNDEHVRMAHLEGAKTFSIYGTN